MRIVIDMQGAQGASRDRGIGRYTRSMVREFLKAAYGHEVFLLFNGMLPDAIHAIRSELHGLFKPENVRVWFAQSPVCGIEPANATRRELAETIWEGAVRSLQPDWLLVTSMFEGLGDDAIAGAPADRNYAVGAILYDLIPLMFHHIYLRNDIQRRHYAKQLVQLERCDLLLAISQATAKDAWQVLKFPKARIAEIGAAIDEDFAVRWRGDSGGNSLLTRPYLLYVSGADDRKNHTRLISAYSRLPRAVRSEHQLALVGSFPPAIEDSFREQARAEGLADDEVVIIPSVSEQDLNQLYANCKAVVFPSWYEGFGLPVLEAMAFGKAVIGADRSSIPEIISNPNALFDPFDCDAMQAAMLKVLTDGQFRAQLEAEGVATNDRFTWQEVASKALDAMSNHKRAPTGGEAVVWTIDAIKAGEALDMISPDTISDCLARTFRRDTRRQLLLDVSELAQRDARTGIQRVVRSIVMSLLGNAPEGWIIEPVYAKPGIRGFFYAREFTDRFLGLEEPWHADQPVQVWAGDVFCALDLNHGVLLAQKDVLDGWRLDGVAVWTVVYDILPLRLPQYFPDGLENLHAQWAAGLVQHDGAMSISKAVSDDLLAWVKEQGIETHPHFQAQWFHLGADISQSAPSTGLPSDATELLAGLAARPTVLMVGTVEPRKGHAQSLAAFNQLWNAGHDVNLVIVGKEGWNVERLAQDLRQHRELGKRLFWLPGISDEYLDRIYDASKLLLSASEGEGFGLPLIEAAQKGVPLMIRDIPVFREVAGQFAHYFSDSLSPEVLASALTTWLDQHQAGQYLDSGEMPWLTWDKAASQFFERMIYPI